MNKAKKSEYDRKRYQKNKDRVLVKNQDKYYKSRKDLRSIAKYTIIKLLRSGQIAQEECDECKYQHNPPERPRPTRWLHLDYNKPLFIKWYCRKHYAYFQQYCHKARF